MTLKYEPMPKLRILEPQREAEEMRSARSASTMLGALMTITSFVLGGIAWAVVERWWFSS